MNSRSTPPTYRNPGLNEEHPFEEVLRLLRGRSTSPEEWLEDARNQYIKEVDVVVEMLRGLVGVFFALAGIFLVAVLRFWPPEETGCSKSSIRFLLILSFVFVALALFTEWQRRRINGDGKEDGLPENRWLPDGYGVTLLERLIHEEINKVRAHLQKRFRENQVGWKDLGLQPVENTPPAFMASFNLLRTLKASRTTLFLNKRCWLDPAKYEDPAHLSPASAARQADLAKRLIELVSYLKDLQTNPVFLNLSPDVCKQIWPTFERDVSEELSKFVRLAETTTFALCLATGRTP